MDSDENLRFRLTRFDQQICIEFDLIGHRMNWLMTSQAFLFAAFALCVTTTSPRPTLAATWLQYLLPAIGAISAVLVGLAIFAAHRVIDRLKPARAILEGLATEAGFEKLGVDVHSSDHRTGNLPSLILPWTLASAWIVLIGVVL